MSLVGETATASFEVVATRAEVAEFAASIGADASLQRLPTTYHIRWLTRPEVVAIVRQLAADKPASLPVHELQTVESIAPMPLDAPLSLAVKAERTDAIHVTLEAVVSKDERPLVRLHSILRLVP